MKNKIITYAVLGCILGYFLIKYIPILLFVFFTNKGGGELRPEEMKLFNEIKKELNVLEIKRTPEYNISEPKDTVSYSLFIRHIDCSINDLILKKEAAYIVFRINKYLKLDNHFYKYDIIFICKNYSRYDKTFSFLRKDVDKWRATNKINIVE